MMLCEILPKLTRQCGLFVILAAGCTATSTERFVPKATTAKEALVAALDAWKQGRAPGRVADHTPPIEVVDSLRKEGQTLTDFQISGEETNAEGHHRFTVKLTFTGSSGTVDAAFVVFGQDPLWVYREEDYKKLSGT